MFPTPDLSDFDTDHDMERCGVIFECLDGTWVIVEVPNRASDPWNDFQIDNADVHQIPLSPEEYRIVGIMHTHPNTTQKQPTPTDLAGVPDGMIGMVYHPSSGSIIWYTRAGTIDN